MRIISSKLMIMSMILVLLPGFLFLTSCTKDTTTVDDPKSTGWAVGNKVDGMGTILRTINKGLNWELQTTYLTEGANLYGVSAVSVNEAWVVGQKRNGYGLILMTNDGGVNSTRKGNEVMIPNADLKCVLAVSSTEIWAAGDSTTILKSIDGGNTWFRCILPFISQTCFKAITVNGNSAWAVGTGVDTNGIITGIVMHTSDGGMTWKRRGAGQPLPTELNDVQCLSDSLVFLTGYQRFYQSSDSGNFWNEKLFVQGKSLQGLCVLDPNNVWFTAAGKTLYHVHDVVDTVNMPYANTQLFGITGLTDNQIWTCGGYGSGSTESLLLFTNNAGKTWFFGQNKSKAVINRMSFVEQKN